MMNQLASSYCKRRLGRLILLPTEYVGKSHLLSRGFTSAPKPRSRQTLPKMRYFALMFAILSVALYFAGNSVTRKQPKTTFSNDREFKEYEASSGLRRRHKLIPSEKNDQYTFFAVPLCSDTDVKKVIDAIEKQDPSKLICVLNPQDLVDQELADPERRYSAVLAEIKSLNKPMPPGLELALLKQHVKFMLNTRQGTFDTAFILENFPRTIDEAIKFENDVLTISLCVIIKGENMLEDLQRAIENVGGYFEIVGKTIEL